MINFTNKLRDEVLPVNPRQFAGLAEGPLDHIRQFQENLEQFRQSLLADPPDGRPARSAG